MQKKTKKKQVKKSTKKVTKKKTVKKRKTNVKTYNAKIGCWNCDDTYTIKVIKGMNTPEFLQQVDPPCRRCECRTLRIFAEYKMEKEILRDLILHARLEQSHEHDGSTTDHVHYG
jgi:Zn finger protein HypA/HybF involved in hydrogenase expression